MENDKILIQDEQAFWDDVRLAIWRACGQYLNDACVKSAQRSIFLHLAKYIKSDDVLFREAESGAPTEKELRPYGDCCYGPVWSLGGAYFRIERARARLCPQLAGAGKSAAVEHRHDLNHIIPGWASQPSQAEQGEAPNSAREDAKNL